MKMYENKFYSNNSWLVLLINQPIIKKIGIKKR